MTAGHSCFAITAPGLETLVAGELTALGIPPGTLEPGGVAFEATPRQLFQANLELRTASRIVVRLAEFSARAFYELERKAKRVPWTGIVSPGTPVRFRVTSRKSRLYHLDGIAERLHASVDGERPRVGRIDPDAADPEDPDVHAAEQLFLVRIVRDVVTISADSSGALLHRRGYRLAGARAPLRETLAAAMLIGAGFDGTQSLLDPFTGSGTIPIEAALLARRIAPGSRRGFAIERWPSFDPAIASELRAVAESRVLARAPRPIVGADRDAGAIASATGNAERAGVAGDVDFRTAALSAVIPPDENGLVVTNPPYGIRIGARGDLRDLYAALGALLREKWSGWGLAMLSADRQLTDSLGLPVAVRWESTNGGIPVALVTA
ncbi:MAG TPA: class I SAM-dependent RNA methyltransferase [Gemmatimonadales bacterium]